MQQLGTSLCAPAGRCPRAFCSGPRPSGGRQCARAAAAAKRQAPAALRAAAGSSSAGDSSATSSSASRRQLLGASSALLLGGALLLSRPASADEEAVAAVAEAAAPVAVAAVAEEPAAAAAPAAPAPAPAAAPGGIRQKNTPEGAIKLMTNDEATRNMTPTDRQVFSLNRRVQAQNRAPDDFPGFIREGFDITVVGEGYTMDQDGLVFKDFASGAGAAPQDGQQVVFDYTAYNESGAVIDSSYRKGRPAETRLGIQGLIPGFELGIKGMLPGGKRRIVVPPALGPPVGPSTFFSAKQCEVFDVELRAVLKCERRQVMMFSDVVCE